MFLYTAKLLLKVDRKLGDEIEIDFLERLEADNNNNNNNNDNSSNNNSNSSSCSNSNSSSNNNSSNNSSSSNNNSSNNNSSSNNCSSSSNSSSVQNVDIVDNEKNVLNKMKNKSSSDDSSNNNVIDSDSKTENYLPSKSSAIPPAPIRQRRRLRRFRQELERVGVLSKRDCSTNCLNHQGVYGLKLLGTYVPPNKPINGYRTNNSINGNNSSRMGSDFEDRGGERGSGTLAVVLNTLSDVLKFNQITGVHLQRLCACYFG